MTKSRNKTKGNKSTRNRVNPLAKRPTRLRVPRVNFNGQTLLATTIVAPLDALVFQAAQFFRVDCSAGGSVAFAHNSITGLYSEYRFKWVKFHWIPAVAPGVAAGGGRIYMATIHNPEQMATMDASTVATQLATVKSMRDMKSWNAWERFTYNVPLMMRRKWFDVNSSTSVADVNIYDRSVQDYVLAGADAVGATDRLGIFQIEYMVELRGLDNINT